MKRKKKNRKKFDLYQSVKGISAASQIVRAGGAIIIASACEDGLPDHGLYARLLAEAGSPEAAISDRHQRERYR